MPEAEGNSLGLGGGPDREKPAELFFIEIGVFGQRRADAVDLEVRKRGGPFDKRKRLTMRCARAAHSRVDVDMDRSCIAQTGGRLFQVNYLFCENGLADFPLDDLRAVSPVEGAEIQDGTAEAGLPERDGLLQFPDHQ